MSIEMWAILSDITIYYKDINSQRQKYARRTDGQCHNKLIPPVVGEFKMTVQSGTLTCTWKVKQGYKYLKKKHELSGVLNWEILNIGENHLTYVPLGL